MTPVEWVAIGVVGVIAYAACAGVARRLTRVPNSGECASRGAFTCARYKLPKCDYCRDMDSQMGSCFWPFVGAWWLLKTAVTGVARAAWLPLRATYRLTAGE